MGAPVIISVKEDMQLAKSVCPFLCLFVCVFANNFKIYGWFLRKFSVGDLDYRLDPEGFFSQFLLIFALISNIEDIGHGQRVYACRVLFLKKLFFCHFCLK